MPETITIDQIKTLIKEEKIQPSTLFGRDQLIDDPVMKGYVEEERKIATSGEYAHRKRTDEKFDEEREKWDGEKKKLEGEIKQLKTEGAKVKASDLFRTKMKERNLDKTQTKFIEAEQPFFEPENIEDLDKEVDQFMDNCLEDFKKKAEIFGKKVEEEPEKKGGGEPAEETEGEENPFIPD